MAPAQVARWIKQAYPKPVVNSEWLDACCEWVANELHLNPDTQSQAFNVEVENQLLESDLRDSTETDTGLPRNVSAMNNERIRGTPVLVEVTAIMEIGHSAFNLHNVRQARIERADPAGLAQEEGVEDDEGPIPNYPKSMLKLTLCDGTVTIPAIEYRSIPGLKLDETPLGYKILLKDVLVRRGIIFLEPQGIVLKGHSNSERDEHRDRDFVRGLLKRMLKPIPTEEQPPNDDNNDDNHPPQRASPHRPPAQRAAAPEQVRSPLREVSEPPEPRPDGMDMDGEADLPRKRRIPNPQHPLASSAASSSSTLVASRFFSGSSNASSSSETNAITQRLARVLSPVRGDPIDITESSMEDTAPPPRVTPAPGPASGSRSTSAIATTSGKQYSGPGSGSGSKTLRSKISYEEFEFDDEDDEELDAAFLAEIAKVEKEALVNQNQRVAQAVAQSRAASRAASEAPKARDARELTPLPWLPVSSSKSASSSSAHASVPAPAPAHRPQSKPSLSATAREEVILIEDEEDDDKENVPVPKRRVRRRVSATPDDVIDISD